MQNAHRQRPETRDIYRRLNFEEQKEEERENKQISTECRKQTADSIRMFTFISLRKWNRNGCAMSNKAIQLQYNKYYPFLNST